MDGIQIYGENFIDKYNDYSFVSGSTLEAYLYDQKRPTAWMSSTSDDTTEESIEVTFKNWQGSPVERTFDRIILLGHNLKDVQCQYWDGSAWQDITGGSLSNNTSADNIIKIATPVTSYKFRINSTTTQVVDAEKYIGELKVCESIMAPKWRTDYNMYGGMRGSNYRVVDGGLRIWKEYTKQEGSLFITDIELADFNTVMPYFEEANFITIVFYEDFEIQHIYEFSIVNAPNFKPNRKTSLFSLSMELKEK